MVDWPTYASELLTLLDRIETETDDDGTADLARQRFEIAKRHGFTIEFGSKITGMVQ